MAWNDFVTLRDGERFNPAIFTNIIFVDDSKLPNDRKSTQSISDYKKHFKADNVKLTSAQFFTFKVECTSINYQYPEEYFKFTEPSQADYDAMVEYVCDEEDGFWLELINEKRKKKKLKPYTTDIVEKVIDRLEKESVFEVKGPSSMVAGSSIDADDACCICGDGDVNNANQIIYCDMCNIAVHQECYGVPYIPEGQWLCRKCKLSPSTPVTCCLCPNSGGAFKQTSDGRWAHVICAIWLNEVHFGNAVFLEPIEGVDNSLRRRAKLKCLVCRQKMGACLQCSTRSCLKAFHVTCAQQSAMSMRVQAKPDANDPDGMDVQRFVYCHLHSDDDGCDANSRKKRMDDAIRNARRNMAVTTNNGPTVNMPKITHEAVERIAQLVGTDITDIVQFWYMKRQSRCGVPLIKRLQISQKVSRVSISHEDLDDEDRLLAQRYQIMRRGLETGRLLCEQIKKREINKRNHLRVSLELTETLLMPLPLVLERVLHELKGRDRLSVFADPVVVEGYHTIIKKPMDLATMFKKLGDHKYATVKDFRDDFLLMMDNCQKFNSCNDWYIRYGKKFGKNGLAIIADAEQRMNEVEKIHASTNFMEEALEIMFYEAMALDDDGPTTTSRKNSIKEDSEPRGEVKLNSEVKSPPSTPTIKEDKKNTFLSPKETTPKASVFGGNLDLSRSNNKRKCNTPVNKKNKKIKRGSTEANLFKQPSITKFFEPSGSSERRSSLRQVPAPLMQFRNNVTSPLPADVPSSESSAEEDDVRPHRRSARLGEQAKTEVKEDLDGFQHNDIVTVHGLAGRVIDPIQASLDDQIPLTLKSECRSKPRKDAKICVMLFGTENKWDWYPIHEIHAADIFGNCEGVAANSLKQARQWHANILGNV